MRTIETGKNKGKKLVDCEESYIVWASQHRKNFSESNRWVSDDAKAMLVEASETVKVVEEMLKENQNWDDWAGVLEASKEETMLKAIRVVARGYGFDWQGSLIKTLVANEKVIFTAPEMYKALQVVSEGEDMDSLSRVEKTLNMMTYAPGAVRLEKVGDTFKVKYIDRTWSECK